MKVEKGDSPRIIEMKDMQLLIPDNPVIAEQLKCGQQVLEEYREAFRALAK